MTTIKTCDVVIIGAGPVGLFAVFQLGMQGISADVIDTLESPGGQCAELYPEKPIYDIPGLPAVSGQELIDNLLRQISPFEPRFHFGELVESISQQQDGTLFLTTKNGTLFKARAVIIAAGGGSFQPKKPTYPGIDTFENTSVFYAVRERERLRGKSIAIAGGGDSALDWALDLQPIAKRVTLIHRRDVFRAAPHSLAAMRSLVANGDLDLVIGQVSALGGEAPQLSSVTVRHDDGAHTTVAADVLLPFFGLIVKFGPIAGWGLQLSDHRIVVDTEAFQTSMTGVHAIGDVNYYPGKLKLILSGFHESALAAHAVAKRLHPERAPFQEHSTSSSILHKKLRETNVKA